MSDNPAAYVKLAIHVIENFEGDYETLVAWWSDERQNRIKWNLSPHQWPGVDLDQAFRNKLRSYQ